MGLKRFIASCRRHRWACRCIQRYTCSCLLVFLLACSAFVFLYPLLYTESLRLQVPYESESAIGPIDVVYTWVNGSDPELLRTLQDYKLLLLKKLREATAAEEECEIQKQGLACTSDGGLQICKDTRCSQGTPHPGTSMNIVILQGRNASRLISYDIRQLAPVRPRQVLHVAVNGSEDNATALLFASYSSVQIMVKPAMLLYRQQNFSLFEGFVAASCCGGGCAPLEDYFIVDGLVLNSSSTNSSLQRLLESNTAGLQIYVWPQNYTTVLHMARSVVSAIRDSVLSTLRGIPGVKIKPALVVWKCSAKEPVPTVDIDSESAPSRFEDNEELRYSLRSIEKYAPFVRNVYIVTNGQIPSWLNLNYPRVSIVSHEDIFLNKTHLPTFSSPSIESHIHRIKGLSRYFIYLNDDVLFGQRVYPSDFLTPASGQKVYLSWPLPSCTSGCASSWLADGSCDNVCNVAECGWDGGDCKGVENQSHGSRGVFIPPIRLTGAFCHGTCADSWLGDRYCDTSCNVYECGYDAGDCEHGDGRQLFQARIQDILVNGTFRVPSGHLAAQVLFDGYLDEIQSGEYVLGVNTTAPHGTVISRKFKFFTLIFVVNTSGSLHADIRGKRNGTNVTAQFNISFNAHGALPNVTSEVVTLPHRVLPQRLPSFMNATNMPALFPVDKSLVLWRSGKPGFPLHSRNISVHGRGIRNRSFTGGARPSQILSLAENEHSKSRSLPHQRRVSSASRTSITYPIITAKPATKRRTKLGRIRRRLLSVIAGEPADSARAVDMNSSMVNGMIIKARRGTSFLVPNHPFEKNTGSLPWENRGDFDNLRRALDQQLAIKRLKARQFHRQRRLLSLDTYGASLTHVNTLYNRKFGYGGRKVPAHMPHFVDMAVMQRLHEEFPEEFDVTSSHKVRAGDDMQFAFSYFYFLMEEMRNVTIEEIFSELDRDKSGYLSPGELRALLVQMYNLPILQQDIAKFRETLVACATNMSASQNGHGVSNKSNTSSSTQPSEHGDLSVCGMSPWLQSVNDLSKVNFSINCSSASSQQQQWPPVTSELLSRCPAIASDLLAKEKRVSRNKFEKASSDDTQFMMIRADIGKAVQQLDEVVKLKRKFICLNDNIEHHSPEALKTPEKNLLPISCTRHATSLATAKTAVKQLLKEFYEAQFPTRSQFELPEGERNRYLHVKDSLRWNYLLIMHRVGHIVLCILALTLIAIALQFAKGYVHMPTISEKEAHC